MQFLLFPHRGELIYWLILYQQTPSIAVARVMDISLKMIFFILPQAK